MHNFFKILNINISCFTFRLLPVRRKGGGGESPSQDFLGMPNLLQFFLDCLWQLLTLSHSLWQFLRHLWSRVLDSVVHLHLANRFTVLHREENTIFVEVSIKKKKNITPGGTLSCRVSPTIIKYN